MQELNGSIFQEDATFKVCAPLIKCGEGLNCVSFECLNAPNYYLKLVGGYVIIGRLNGSFDDNQKATWIIEDGRLRGI